MSVEKRNKKDEKAAKITSQGYSFGFKIQVLAEVENGQLSINQAAKKYQISRSAIQKWMNQMGNKDKKLRELKGQSSQQEIKSLKKKIKELEMQRAILESAIEILEDEYGIDVKKKCLPESAIRLLKEPGKR